MVSKINTQKQNSLTHFMSDDLSRRVLARATSAPEHMVTDELFGVSNVAVMCGPRDLSCAVAFRVANEVAARGGHAIFLRRNMRGSEQPSVPMRTTLLRRGLACADDSLRWELRWLQRVDEIQANNMHEFKSALGAAHTLQCIPDLIIAESLSELIDPLYATDHSDFEFLNQALMARCFLDDTAAAMGRMPRCIAELPKIIITDSAPLDSAYIRLVSRDGASVSTVSGSAAGSGGVHVTVEVRRLVPSERQLITTLALFASDYLLPAPVPLL